MAVVGIDLGTTNSCIATVQNGRVEVVPDPKGNAIHPSVVALLPDGMKLFSHDAISRRITAPRHTIYSVKRLIGQPFRSELVRMAALRMPYEIQEGSNEQAVVVGPDRTYTVPELSGALLLYLRQCAELHLGDLITGVVITVPANFNDSQRRATIDAGRIAGLDVLRVLNEPTAAALAYGLGRNISQRIAVYDFGGGTFDVTILQVEGDVFEVLATGGDSFLGGDDADEALMNLLAQRFLDKHSLDPRQEPQARARLLLAAEQIKKALSVQPEARGTLKQIMLGPAGTPLDLPFEVQRSEFEAAIARLVSRTIETCDDVLSRAGLMKTQIDEIILVGGTTRIPLVRQEVARAFGKTPRIDIDPDQVVAWGAALQADNLAATTSSHSLRPVLLDVTSRALGIAVAGGYAEPIVERNVPIPAEQSRLFTTSTDNQTSVRIQVCQGESRRFEENAALGELHLDGLPPARRGQVKIEVTFRVDTNGILRVRARDPDTGAHQEAAISVRGTMSEDEVNAAAEANPGLPSLALEELDDLTESSS
jgi:molecular chaperone DnaK